MPTIHLVTRIPRRLVFAALGVLALGSVAVLAGCGTTSAEPPGATAPGPPGAGPGTAGPPGAGGSTGPVGATGRATPPPAHARFDYQIGGAYPPPAGVRVVSRDRGAAPAPGLYTICYLNAFQAQTADSAWWRTNHDPLLLKGSGGGYVIDPDWNEEVLDISTEAKRQALATIVNGWIDGCAAAGFQAVEPDNLDSWTRSGGLLTRSDALAYSRLLITHAHARGLAVGQKNAAELGTSGHDAGMDFAVVEECGRYRECDAYIHAYGDHVLDIEYDRTGFATACHTWGGTLSVVLRDRMVTTPGSATYTYAAC
jgi:hypothetical protein